MCGAVSRMLVLWRSVEPEDAPTRHGAVPLFSLPMAEDEASPGREAAERGDAQPAHDTAF